MSISKLVVVCTGNICRSPIAETVLKSHANGHTLEIHSAGTHALTGHGADPNAQAVVADHGLSLDSHCAQQATPSLLGWADLILTLEQLHTDWIVSRYPHLRGRVFKLGKWRGNADIEDPYQKPKAAFEKAYDEISVAVDDWLGKLRQIG